MIRKLMKYEWLSTRRMILPFYILMLSIALINGLFFRFEKVGGFASEIAEIILVSSQIVIIIATFVFVIYWMLRRFYKNIYSDEGYLTHTLPVKSWQHIIAKLIVAVLWWAGTFIILFVSLFLLGVIVAPEDFKEFFQEIVIQWESIKQIISETDMILCILEVMISVFLGGIFFYTKAYCAISLGQMMARHKIMLAIGFYIAFGFIENIISTTAFWNLVLETSEIEENITAMVHWFQKVLGFSIIYSIVATIIYFLITKYVMDKKLNI